MKSTLLNVTFLCALTLLNTSSFAQIEGLIFEPTLDAAYKAGHQLCSGGPGIQITLTEIDTGNSNSAWKYACGIIAIADFSKCPDDKSYVVIKPLNVVGRSECRSSPT